MRSGLAGGTLTMMLDSAATGGQLMMGRFDVSEGEAPPYHQHTREDEVFMLIKGTALVLPKGTPHGYRITSKKADLLMLNTPPGSRARSVRQDREGGRVASPAGGRDNECMTAERAEARVVRASREIAADPGPIFELIADPARQPSWDGNSNLAEAAAGQRVRRVGDMFRMTITSGAVRENHVTEFEEGRLIAWMPSEPGQDRPGHRWRWELEPAGQGRTRATITYDWTGLTDEARLSRARATTADRLQASLDLLAALAEAPGEEASERIEVQRMISADAAAIFRVLCDPQGHVAIDSAGMLMDATGETVTGVGDSFVVHMDREALNDFPMGHYDVTVTIETFVREKEIAWTILGLMRPPIGHVYGYRLEPAAEGTLVTSYYDWSSIHPDYRKAGIFPVISEGALRATLGILARTVARGYPGAGG